MKTCFSYGKVMKQFGHLSSALPLSKKTPLSTNPLITPFFVQTSKTRIPRPNFQGGGEETMQLLIKKYNARSNASFSCDHSNNSVTTKMRSVNIFMWAYICCSSHSHSINILANPLLMPYHTELRCVQEFQLQKIKE